ncbi:MULTISPECIES: TIGR03905 family TSCPD domain-containing protein [Lachnospiraceae]|uniref:TIGR03905 family TSCPD domain-containing protein n=1 Tax=Lachnospiraceae TaxID=186803 RepID=UPI0023F0B1E6|nr:MULTISPECIES: TIGR03905 family TSCPD domain-containing protein [Clostridia]
MEFSYVPHGVCAKEFHFEMDGDRIKHVEVTGGCPGNLLGIGKLISGKTADEVIEMFQGLKCGARPTSCPDQMSLALTEYLKEQKQ